MPKPDQTAYDPFTPAPGSARILGTRDAFSLWFSLGVGLLVLQTGSLLTPGLGAPVIWIDGKPLNRATTLGPARYSVSTTPASGTIWP